MNYYNEFDKFAASWLEQLIHKNLIPAGYIDRRSITEVKSDDLTKYTQCHFFAGIGGWSEALRIAGWDNTRPVWTGSCPCQPFSSAGNQKGKDDERHLWPVWFNLIRQSRPPIVFGEQVSAAIRHGWWDDVADDMEREGYTTRAEIRTASSVGAPHKRERLWFMAHTESKRGLRESSQQRSTFERSEGDHSNQFEQSNQTGSINVANTISSRQQRQGKLGQPIHSTARGTREADWPDNDSARHWQGEWIDCPDGKQRLIEPSIRLLANGVSNRVGKLRGYGNAITPQVAAEFIRNVT